jgi:hypothetical protein
MFALYRSGAKIFKSDMAGFLSAIIFLLWIDNIHWNTTAMTESLSYSLTTFVLYRLVYFKDTLKDYCWIIVLVLLSLFTRPTGIIILIGSIVFFLNYHWPLLTRKPILKLSVLFALLFVCYLGGHIMFALWDFTEQYKKGNIVTYMDVAEGNTLYRENLRFRTDQLEFIEETKHPIEKIYHFILDNPVNFIRTGSLKIFYLIAAVRPYYSFVHNLYLLAWMSFIYFLFGLGWWKADHSALTTSILTIIIINCCLIGISTVDWDNRFYIPMAPGIVLFAGGGASYLVTIIRLKLLNDGGNLS